MAKHKVFQIEPELYQVLLTTSDPDFPFSIPVLDFDLHLSRHYPNQDPPPYITFNNDNVPKSNAINVEAVFNEFEGTLDERVATLDKRLESLISMTPAKTITIVKPKLPSAVPKSSTVEPKMDSTQNNGAQAEIKVGELKIEEDKPEDEDNDGNESSEDDYNPEYRSDGEDHNSDDHEDEQNNKSDEDEKSDGDGYAHFSDDEDIDSGAPAADMNKPMREGTELVFSNIKLTNIALCEIVSLNMLLQCGRCKTPHTFNNLQSSEYDKPTKPRAELCSKCDLPLLVAFRKEYLHSMSHSADYLDIDGGRALDLLLLSYTAMCGKCQHWSPVFKNVDMGAHRMVNCRNCHTKLWIQLEQFDFVLIYTATISSSAQQAQTLKLPATSGTRQKLNLVRGEPLPRYGSCEHYGKSMRWFRFSCCQRVFACDLCHDAEMRHSAKHTTRMVCGYCSREQRFTPKCVYCEHDYTQRVTRFWECGAGVRDRKLMSRKDKRKYRRNPHEKEKSVGPHFKGKSKTAPHRP